eukprot:PhM_4_TR16088/c0_g1_i2/m.92048
MGCAASVNVKNNNEAEVTTNGLDHQSIETNNEIILCNSVTTTTENEENNNNNNNTMAMMMVPVQVILDADGTFTKIVGEFTVEDALALGLPPATISALQYPVYVGMEEIGEFPYFLSSVLI